MRNHFVVIIQGVKGRIPSYLHVPTFEGSFRWLNIYLTIVGNCLNLQYLLYNQSQCAHMPVVPENTAAVPFRDGVKVVDRIWVRLGTMLSPLSYLHMPALIHRLVSRIRRSARGLVTRTRVIGRVLTRAVELGNSRKGCSGSYLVSSR